MLRPKPNAVPQPEPHPAPPQLAGPAFCLLRLPVFNKLILQTLTESQTLGTEGGQELRHTSPRGSRPWTPTALGKTTGPELRMEAETLSEAESLSEPLPALGK